MGIRLTGCEIILLLLFLIHTPLFPGDGENTLTLEYVPITVMSLSGGIGLGAGYERGTTVNCAWRIQGEVGVIPVTGGGYIAMAGLAVGYIWFPLSQERKGFVLLAEGGFTYLKAAGDSTYGDLHSSFILPYGELSGGWRFRAGNRSLALVIQPELCFTLILPGKTVTGEGDNYRWGDSGFIMAILNPNITMGVTF